jgi:hypothetical protein
MRFIFFDRSLCRWRKSVAADLLSALPPKADKILAPGRAEQARKGINFDS